MTLAAIAIGGALGSIARHLVNQSAQAMWMSSRIPAGTAIANLAGCFVIACMASVGMPGTVNFIAEVMIIVGSWNKYPLQVIVAVIGIVITLAYLFRMMRGLFYGPMDQKYSHSHDAVAVVDRLPLLIMILVSIGFGSGSARRS